MAELVIDEFIYDLLKEYKEDEGYLICRKNAIEMEGSKKDLGIMIIEGFEKIRNSLLIENADYFYVPVIYGGGSSNEWIKKIEEYIKKDNHASKFFRIKRTPLINFVDYISIIKNGDKVDHKKIYDEKYMEKSIEELKNIDPNYLEKLNKYQLEIRELLSSKIENKK